MDSCVVGRIDQRRLTPELRRSRIDDLPVLSHAPAVLKESDFRVVNRAPCLQAHLEGGEIDPVLLTREDEPFHGFQLRKSLHHLYDCTLALVSHPALVTASKVVDPAMILSLHIALSGMCLIIQYGGSASSRATRASSGDW